MTSILNVKDLSVRFLQDGLIIDAVNKISFQVTKGETVALVGESGSGKSVTALSTAALLGKAALVSGQISIDGESIDPKNEKALQKLRGNKLSFIFQEPMTSLNPLHTIEKQLSETITLHQSLNKETLRDNCETLLEKVGIRDAKYRLNAYPHQLSGGQRQRVMIAMALACEPKILIADEPTTALDVTVQAQIFGLLKDLQAKTGTSIILITHDMGAVAQMARKMIVMYAGRPCEIGEVEQVIQKPRHPYTSGLISCVPHLDDTIIDANTRLSEIPGIVPSIREFGSNKCLFASRCKHQMEQCWAERPGLTQISNKQAFACWKREILDAG